MEIPDYGSMINAIAHSADRLQVIEDIRIYTNWVLVKTGTWSLSTIFRGMPGFEDRPGMDSWMGDWLGKPGLESALELLSSRDTLRRAVGMACLKSLLPIPSSVISGNAITMVEAAAAKVPTCFIGYFKEAAEWREKGLPVTIVELFPKPGDIHWDDADEVLGKAQIVLMSGLTVVNETLTAVIRRTPSARIRVMMGPTVPPSSVLFDYGIDMLGVTLVSDMKLMARYAELGGGSISYSPPGALVRINLVKDSRDFYHNLASMTTSKENK
ncbi:MAG TPA: DUF364 domain-containing protein [Methanospirillum sp.]|nr:DUF364 domain-containing protein [Methanospirillum sp.]